MWASQYPEDAEMMMLFYTRTNRGTERGKILPRATQLPSRDAKLWTQQAGSDQRLITPPCGWLIPTSIYVCLLFSPSVNDPTFLPNTPCYFSVSRQHFADFYTVCDSSLHHLPHHSILVSVPITLSKVFLCEHLVMGKSVSIVFELCQLLMTVACPPSWISKVRASWVWPQGGPGQTFFPWRN